MRNNVDWLVRPSTGRVLAYKGHAATKKGDIAMKKGPGNKGNRQVMGKRGQPLHSAIYSCFNRAC